jgi:hypothetical protein
MEYLAMGARCLIATVFLVSAASKVAGRSSFREFVGSVRRMRLLRPGLVHPVAWSVVVLEFTVVGLLVVPIRLAGLAGFAISAGLLVTFAFVIVLAIKGGVRAPCRCFGTSTTLLGVRHVVRNSVLLAVAASGVATELLAGTARFDGLIVAALSGLVLGGLVTMLDDIVGLFQPANLQ